MALLIRDEAFTTSVSYAFVIALLMSVPLNEVRAQATGDTGTAQPATEPQKDPLRSLKRLGSKVSNFLANAGTEQAPSTPEAGAPHSNRIATDAKKTGGGEDLWAAAVKRADDRIDYFQKSLRYGTDLGVRDAALELQKDPIAVARLNGMKDADFLRERMNVAVGTVKGNTKSLVRERIAEHFGVPVSEVTFLEATNPSKTVKVGQDWDITVRVRGKDVDLAVAEPIVHEAYYRSATGREPLPGKTADFAREARLFAHQQSIEVINYQGAEAYGGSKTEGEKIITGPKNQELRDPAQLSKAIQVKSDLPRDKALSLEADARKLHSEAVRAEAAGNASEAAGKRLEAREKMLDAQGWWLEQARQYDKQFEKQIKPRIEELGGKVPSHVENASKILNQVAKGDISPAEGRARLDAMGETPESVINKGAGLVEASQVVRSPKDKGKPAQDVVEGNVKDKMALRELEKSAANKPAHDAAPDGVPGKGGAVARTGGTAPRAPGADAPATPGKSAGAGKPAPAAGDAGAQRGKTMNVMVNVAQFAECMQRRPDNLTKASWSMECLKEQAMGFLEDAVTGAAIETIAFYAPGVGLVGQAAMSAYGVWVAGGQVGDATVEGIQWWDALTEEARSKEHGEKNREKNVPLFALRLNAKEAQIKAEINAITAERQKIGADIERLGREQHALRAKAPSVAEFDRRVRDFGKQFGEAQRECKNAALSSVDRSQQRLQELSLEAALEQAVGMARGCKGPDDARQADAAWQRASELRKNLANDSAETLLSDASLFANTIKDLADEARRISQEKEKIPARIRALEGRINGLENTLKNFTEQFPKDLIDSVTDGSTRLQVLEALINRTVNVGGGADPHGTIQLESAFSRIAATSLEDLIKYPERRMAGEKTLNFTQVFDELLYEVARCRGTQREESGERATRLFANAEKEFRKLRNECGARIGEAAKPPAPVVVDCNTTSKAGTNPPQTITVNVGRAAGTVSFSYDMFRIPDHMEVQYGGQVVADTGCVSGRKSIAIPLSGVSDQVTVVVKPACEKSAQTRWNFTLGCPGAASAASAASNSPAASANGNMTLLEMPRGDVRVFRTTSAESTPLRDSSQIADGVSVQTGSGAQTVLKSPTETRVIITEGSLVRVSKTPPDQQNIELQRGAVEVERSANLTGSSKVNIETEDGVVTSLHTRYRVEKMASGTRVQVFEGRVRVTGGYIVKIHAPNVEHGKPSPATELVLQAGEQAIIRKTAEYTAARNKQPHAGTPGDGRDERFPTTTPPVPVGSEPWNDPKVQQLIDEWLRNAKPAVRADLPGPWRFSEWGQVLGPGSKAAGAPDHPSGWTRHQALWARRMQFDSLNLCSMGEYIERRLAGRGMEGCEKTAPGGMPSWLAPSAPPVQPGSDGGGKAANAIAQARVQVQATQAAQQQAQPPVQPQAQPPAQMQTPQREQAVPTAQPTPPQRPLLDRVIAIPDEFWHGAKPDLNAPGFRKLMVLQTHIYDPRMPNCARAAQRAGVTVVGITARPKFADARWPETPTFPIVLDYRARDLIYAVEAATGRKPILVPVPPAFAYLLDRDGRLLDHGECEAVVNKIVGGDIGMPGGRR